jgi:cell division protein FtsB
LLALAAWLLFFDKNDIFIQYERHQEVKKLEKEVNYYKTRIESNREEQKELQSNPKELEKFAREHYLMKKDNEEIYVFVTDSIN